VKHQRAATENQNGSDATIVEISTSVKKERKKEELPKRKKREEREASEKEM